jgi:hypothetical protein
MIEGAWALGLLLAIGAVAALGAMDFGDLIELGQTVMLGCAAVGIPLELLYFALLARTIKRHPDCPRGWYWRPFAHHHLLTPRARLLVLPVFYLGALAFLGIVLGIGTVLLAFLSAASQTGS